MILRLFVLALFLLAGSAVACVAPQAQTPEPDAASLLVVEPQLEKVAQGDGGALATLVSLRNTAASCFDDVVLQVRYFDADKKLIDSATEAFSGIVVPSGKTVAYRLDSKPLRPLADYVSQEVTVVSAQPRYSYAPRTDTFAAVLVAWLPFTVFVLFMLGFLLFIVRAKRSPQNRALALAEVQVQQREQQIRQLQRIADALDARAGRDGAAP